ncbi:MmpL efflux pump [Trypanosoma grayi]|uniref:MmpL efflux pump n=1 Tax=Trypanosoma grayi TaxID=71804 RepID=UPI0004F4B6CD|nr:MmpL efflux pump [Trypanosoma grayi]KEG14668.1 MmpL efflux pump [Trypanosoma grayi]
MQREKKIALVLVVLYSLALFGGACLAWRFIHNTRVTYRPPKGTLVYHTNNDVAKYFPNQLSVNPMFFLVTSHNSSQSIVENPHFEAFSYFFQQQTANKGGPIYGIVNNVLGYFLVPDADGMRSRFVGGDHNQSSVLELSIAPELKTDLVLPVITSLVDAWCEESGADFLREYTSIELLSDDARDGIVSDLMRVDVISLPLAFLVLSYCMGSVRPLLVPAFSLPCTVVIAFSIMYPISFAVDVSSFAPELTLGVTAAICVDYSLFILTRFREQVRQQEFLHGRSAETEWIVVRNTARLSAHNIVVSGFTIAVAVGSLSFLPVAFLSTIGLTMSVAVICAVLVSLTAQPALLLLFYNFFARPPTWRELWDTLLRYCRCFCCCGCCRRGSPSDISSSMGEELLSEPVDALSQTTGSFEAEEHKRQVSSVWFRIGLFSFHHPLIAIMGVLVFGAPFFYFATQLRVDFDVFTQIPRGSVHGEILNRIQRDVGNGAAIPFYILFVVRGTYDISFWKTDEMTNVMKDVIEAIVARTGQTYDAIISPNMVRNSTSGELIWLKAWESFLLYATNEDYQYLVNRTVSALEGRAAYIIVTPPTNPFGPSANRYLNTIRDVLREHASENIFFDYGITGASSSSWAIIVKSMELFPMQIGVTFGAIFLFILIVFRSLVLPFRMIFTVVYTIGFSYGVGVIVFQYTWLHKVWGALDHVESYCFLIPIFAFLLLSALALDYDVFLMTRVIEFKTKGYTNEAAIAKAVWKTGPVISFAGIIMFVTIGSLVFSSIMMLAQFAVVSGVAVLLDTFVIRPLFVPALLSIVPEKWLWWPRRFPELGCGVDVMCMDPNSTLGHTVQEEENLPASLHAYEAWRADSLAKHKV